MKEEAAREKAEKARVQKELKAAAAAFKPVGYENPKALKAGALKSDAPLSPGARERAARVAVDTSEDEVDEEEGEEQEQEQEEQPWWSSLFKGAAPSSAPAGSPSDEPSGGGEGGDEGGASKKKAKSPKAKSPKKSPKKDGSMSKDEYAAALAAKDKAAREGAALAKKRLAQSKKAHEHEEHHEDARPPKRDTGAHWLAKEDKEKRVYRDPREKNMDKSKKKKKDKSPKGKEGKGLELWGDDANLFRDGPPVEIIEGGWEEPATPTPTALIREQMKAEFYAKWHNRTHITQPQLGAWPSGYLEQRTHAPPDPKVNPFRSAGHVAQATVRMAHVTESHYLRPAVEQFQNRLEAE